jgi:hypothetical protein
MKTLILLSGLIFSSFGIAHAQRNPEVIKTPLPAEIQRQDGQADINRRSDELKNVENFPVKSNNDAKIFREFIYPLYREPDKKELQILVPSVEDVERFSFFLRQPRAGLIKLVPERNCDSGGKVTSASPDCSKYSIPGAGSSYSFRIDNYRIARLADINYTGRNFRAFGVLTHGILVSIGDVPLENVDSQSEAVISLIKLQPVTDFKEAEEFALKLDKGIQNKDLIYRNILPVMENTTYLLRSIAYKGNSTQTIQGITFDEMELDKRKDVVVAFRVVRRDADGSVTLLWKELTSKNSPKLKAAK